MNQLNNKTKTGAFYPQRLFLLLCFCSSLSIRFGVLDKDKKISGISSVSEKAYWGWNIWGCWQRFGY
jgi:hypothetical protein